MGQSRIEKLRVLAVRAEPATVLPGAATTLDVLTALPENLVGEAALSSLWLACPKPEGVATPLPCGVAAGSFGEDFAHPTPLPRCDGNSQVTLCIIGDSATVTYQVPPMIALSEEGAAQVLLTQVTSNAGTALDCLIATSFNGSRPVDADHCVISVKRLEIADRLEAPSFNLNPTLLDMTLAEKDADAVSLLAADASFALAPEKGERSRWTLEVTRAEDAAEIKSDGTYEALAVSWFSTGGEFVGGRSTFTPEGCAAQADCADLEPTPTSSAEWIAPTELELPDVADERGGLRYYTVVRDDRGGVAWLKGSARAR